MADKGGADSMHDELSGEVIRSVDLPQSRRRGYDVAAVDDLLHAVAGQLDRLRDQVGDQERSERAAMLLLQQAQQTADQTLEQATSDARDILEGARHEAKQRLDGADAQIEASFAEATARLNRLERLVESHRRELAMLEAGSARFVAEQASHMREQAQVLLAAAASITSDGETGQDGETEQDLVDRHFRAEDLLAR